MPPRKRTKKASPPSPPHPPSKNDTNVDGDQDEDQVEPQNQDDTDGKTTTDTDGDATFDPALLDEEEAPGASASDDDTTTTIKPPRTPYSGGCGYNALKTHKDGTLYTGMSIGGTHTWTYSPGTWTETKTAPDLWKIDYRTSKHRARKAPRGFGAPVGTEYHWLIVAHQYVEKMDANTYETHLVGSKYKLAHRGAGKREWSVPTVKGQREREVELLEDAKRRVLGLPPVTAGEKVRDGIGKREKGQMRLDRLFKQVKKEGGEGGGGGEVDGGKRKREEEGDDDEEDIKQGVGVVTKEDVDGEF
ncbi:hypothetical protein VTN00DRAFT_10063 [Thermoascus crustaceus]|uniref:uncharacterized protein n=1 Tax=Thermoascus crustaceus TaxID=5088 RepID=UPI003743F3B5